MVVTLGNSAYRLGIDFGSLNLHFALQHKKKVTILTTEQGNRSLPTYLTFGKEELSIGEVAQVEEKNYDHSTIYHAKRFLGRTLSEIAELDYVRNYPFTIQASNSNDEIVTITYGKDKEKTLSLEEYCTYFFQEIKKRADNYTNENVTLCVLTVPVFYTTKECNLLEKAANNAGLHVLRMMKEPIAACIAYDLDVRQHQGNEEENHGQVPEEDEDEENEEEIVNTAYEYAVVMDLGGTKCTFSLVHMERGLLRIIANKVYHDMGGEEYTRLLMEYCINQFMKKYSLNLKESSKAIQKLKYACENAKRSLSQQNMARIEIDSIYQNKDLTLKISSAQFHSLISSSLSTIQKNMLEFLNANELEPMDIERIIVCGGCAYLPAIQELANQMFPEKQILSQTNPDEVVAIGAATQADILADTAEWDLPKEDIQSEMPVVPLTLGVKDCTTGSVVPLIMQGSLLPAKGREKFTVQEGAYEAFGLEIYQGEYIFAEKNQLLATITLKDFITTECKKKVTVEMEVTRDGNLIIIIKNSIGQQKEFTIKSSSSKNSTTDIKAKIKKMIEEAKSVREEELDKLDELEVQNEDEETASEENDNVNELEPTTEKVSKMTMAVDMD